MATFSSVTLLAVRQSNVLLCWMLRTERFEKFRPWRLNATVADCSGIPFLQAHLNHAVWLHASKVVSDDNTILASEIVVPNVDLKQVGQVSEPEQRRNIGKVVLLQEKQSEPATKPWWVLANLEVKFGQKSKIFKAINRCKIVGRQIEELSVG